MEYAKIQQYKNNSPAWELLRARSAPLILAFLHLTFKEKNIPTISANDLEGQLAEFIEYIAPPTDDEEDEHANALERATKYLTKWVNQAWLRKYPDENGADQYELTSDVEKTLQFVGSLERRAFVGTESRFKDIFRRLHELVEGSQEDPKTKIDELKAKRSALNAQIREIERTDRVQAFDDTQIQERFYELNKNARELLADFKEVEANFKDITRGIYEKQADNTLSKGNLLGYALDKINELKDNDQGRSFYAFWEFLISDQRQDELKTLVRALFNLLLDRGLSVDDPLLRNLKLQLHQNGQKVFESNQMLASKLNRIIAEQNLRERKRALQAIAEIRKIALERGMESLRDPRFWQVESDVEFTFPCDRPLGEAPAAVRPPRPPEAAGGNPDNADFSQIFAQFSLDRKRLQGQIKVLLREHPQVSLEEVVHTYPITKGLTEVLTYLAIASASSRHYIQENVTWQLTLDAITQKVIEIPQVIYTR